MKISKLFHWLYFTVMMLPIFILPIFALAVRSDNNYQPISVSVENNIIVDYNQQIDGTQINVTNGNTYFGSLGSLNNANIGDVLYIKYFQNASMTTNVRNTLMLYYDNGSTQKQDESNNRNLSSGYYSWYLTASHNYTNLGYWAQNQNASYSLQDIQFFNLTQMFGAGNEPSASQFDLYFPNTYYSYSLGTDLLVNLGFLTFNDTDFASQTIYTMYQGVNKYFNYDSVFNFGDLYQWLEITFFNGTATLGFFIFWHLLIYWLLTSLLWLLFDVLMYVPLLIHRWLDKASLS